LVRVAAIIFSAPFFGSKRVPLPVKAGLAFLISMTLFPALRGKFELRDGGIGILFAYIGTEVLLGLIIGYTARMIFAAIQLSGQIIGFQMGFGLARVLDPTLGEQVSLISRFQNLVAILIFLALNAHHVFILALIRSFELVPPMSLHYSPNIVNMLVTLTGNVFVVAVKVSAPVFASLVFANIALGIVARAVPQMNVLIVGLPLQIAVGMLMLGLSFPFFALFMKDTFMQLSTDIMLMLRAM
jgi:flagellar biosynthetic protein FliR